MTGRPGAIRLAEGDRALQALAHHRVTAAAVLLAVGP
jgi:hypothetical protein